LENPATPFKNLKNMNKDYFIKTTSKIDQTFEDEFKAKYNSPELIWDNLLHDKFLKDEEIDTIEFCMEELIKRGNHSGKETLFKNLKKYIAKLRN
jgi:hypothetical protein